MGNKGTLPSSNCNVRNREPFQRLLDAVYCLLKVHGSVRVVIGRNNDINLFLRPNVPTIGGTYKLNLYNLN